jgi:hypothetical protein
MTTLALTYTRVQKKVQSKVNSIEIPQVNWKAVCLVGFFITLSLLIFYIWQINDLTKGYYLTNSYEKQIGQLSQENRNLEISFAESSFLGQALEKIQALNFQKTVSVKYIQIPEGALAIAK